MCSRVTPSGYRQVPTVVAQATTGCWLGLVVVHTTSRPITIPLTFTIDCGNVSDMKLYEIPADDMRAQNAHKPEDIRSQLEAEIDAGHAWFSNEKYAVNVCEAHRLVEDYPRCLHLSIRRQDREPIHDWRDLQEIKNALVGSECEGFELYPAESRKHDAANQYHLFVFIDPKVRMPIGGTDRFVRDHNEDSERALGHVQRSFPAYPVDGDEQKLKKRVD